MREISAGRQGLVKKLPNARGAVRQAPIPEQHVRAPNRAGRTIEKLTTLGGRFSFLGWNRQYSPSLPAFGDTIMLEIAGTF